MPCPSLVGIKNIMLTFKDCDQDLQIGPIAHKLATEDIPTVRTCPWTNENLPNGYVKRQASDARMTMNIIRDLRLPLSYYQGCAVITAQLEYENGLVYSGLEGGITGDEESDTHEVELTITYQEIDELLPPGALANAA